MKVTGFAMLFSQSADSSVGTIDTWLSASPWKKAISNMKHL